MHDAHLSDRGLEYAEPPVSIRRIFSVLRAYSGMIILSLAAVATAYILLAACYFLFSPAQRVVALPFRLEFDGAEVGTYPNGLKFSGNEIISTPILLDVYNSNDLKRFAGFPAFAHSVYVIETNKTYERVAAQYRARLADTRLSAVDRERIEKEFDDMVASINKNEYTISINVDGSNVPPEVGRKALSDILNAWARHAAVGQGVLHHDVAVMSPGFVAKMKIDPNDLLSTVLLLRTTAHQIIDNLEYLDRIPGARLIRTPKDLTSIQELSLRLDDMLRFNIEPLVAVVTTSPGDVALATRLLETQLAYDQRQLSAQQQRVDAIRQTLATYATSAGATTSLDTASFSGTRSGTTKDDRAVAPDAAMVPQLSDSFIDRIVQLASGATDQTYRQQLANDLRTSSLAMIPLQSSVEYHRQALEQVRANAPRPALPREQVVARVMETRRDLESIVSTMNDLYILSSSNLSPSTELYRVTAPATTTTFRTVSLPRLFLYGVVVLLAMLPVLVVIAFIHNRLRQEEASDVVAAPAT